MTTSTALRGHALITGGGTGIGLEMAKVLAKEGCDITLIDITAPDAAVAELKTVEGVGKVQGLTADVTDYNQISSAVRAAEKDFGGVTILVANAGILLPATTITQQAPDVYERVMKVNYLGVIYTVKAALPGMLERDEGRILIMSSMSGVVGMYGLSSYSASKAAIRNWSDVLRLEVLGTGVSVHIAQPKFVATGMGERCIGCMEPWLQKWIIANSGSLDSTEKVAHMIIKGIRKKNNYLVVTPNFSTFQIIQATAGFLAPTAFSLLFEMFIVAPLQALGKRIFRGQLEGVILDARRNNLIGKTTGKKAN